MGVEEKLNIVKTSIMALEQKISQGGFTWLALRAIATLVVVFAGRFLYKGYQQRKRVKKLRSQGIVSFKLRCIVNVN